VKDTTLSKTLFNEKGIDFQLEILWSGWRRNAPSIIVEIVLDSTIEQFFLLVKMAKPLTIVSQVLMSDLNFSDIEIGIEPAKL
jgi:hypothetical protein